MLLGLPIIEVAIGLILVYLFSSLICSAINEMIEGVLKNRATDLEKGLRALLQDPQGNGIVKELYNHPLVFGLFKGEYHSKSNPTRLSFWRYLTPTNLPSYIPAANFSRALLDIVLNPSTAGASAPPAGTPATPAPSTGGTPAAPATSTPMTMANLQQAVAGIPNQYIKSALSSLLETAGRDINAVRKNVEEWFDSSMDRVAGWYKRRTQWILLVMGLVVAVVFNVSTITISHHLWIDAPLREAVVSKAASQQQGGSAGKTPGERLTDVRDALNSLGLPIGWSDITFKEHSVVVSKTEYSRRYWFLISALGWLLTACAVSFGAPFWFDLLNKFLVIRSTIKPEKKSLEDK